MIDIVKLSVISIQTENYKLKKINFINELSGRACTQVRRRGGALEGTEGRAKAAAARVAGNANTREERGQARGLGRGAHVARGGAHDGATGASARVAGGRVQEKTDGGQPPLQSGAGEQ